MKKVIRQELLKQRDSIAPEVKIEKEKSITEKLLASEAFKRANTILFYASFRSEVDTFQCIKQAFKLMKKVALPLVDRRKRELRLYEIKDISELSPSYMGIPEPGIIKNREMSLKDIDVAIIPGAGFDVKGNRLGYGAGYYDKLLSKSKKHIPTIALAFEEQITDEINAEPHDVKIDKIITDKRMVQCRG